MYCIAGKVGMELKLALGFTIAEIKSMKCRFHRIASKQSHMVKY